MLDGLRRSSGQAGPPEAREPASGARRCLDNAGRPLLAALKPAMDRSTCPDEKPPEFPPASARASPSRRACDGTAALAGAEGLPRQRQAGRQDRDHYRRRQRHRPRGRGCCSPAKAATAPSSTWRRRTTPAETRRLVEAEGRRCVTIRGDLGDPGFCAEVAERGAGRSRADRHPGQQRGRAARHRRTW